MAYVYKVYHLPTSDPQLLAFLAGKFAALRLSALTVSAISFSSTFAYESGFSASKWVARLSRPRLHTFVAVAYASESKPEEQTIDRGDWVGSATLMGPLPKAKYELVESGGPEIGEDDVETKWALTAVYNSPSHRRKGVAKMLISNAIHFTEAEGSGRRSRIRIMIHPDNIVVKNLYDGLGFELAGLVTLAEAHICNGDEDLLPEDGGKSDPERYHRRAGIAMERVTSCVD